MFDPLADFFGGLDTTGELGSNRARPAPGRGVYYLKQFGPKKTDKGLIYSATLVVAEPAQGSDQRPGDHVELAWFVYKGEREGGNVEKIKARDFVNAVVGNPYKTAAGAASQKLSSAEQPGTGVALEIIARDEAWKNEKKGTSGVSRVFEYRTIAQTKEDIVRQRAAMDNLGAPAAAVAATKPAAAPAAPSALSGILD